MKPAVKIVGIAALGIAALWILAALFLDSAIRKGIETAGSRSLGVDVRLRSARLSILRGRLTISGMEIPNPEGFKTDTFFKVEQASVGVRLLSLFKDEIEVKGVILKAPSLTIEQSASGSNLSRVLGGIEHRVQKGEKSGEGEAEKKYRINMLSVKEADVTFSSFLTAKAPITVPLSDIEMRNISSDDGTGLALARVIQKVLQEMVGAALIEGRGVIPADMMKNITGNLRGLMPGLTGDAFEQSKGVVEKTKGTLRGLFGR